VYVNVCICTDIHMCTYVQTYICVHMYTHTHVYIGTDIGTYMYICADIHICTYIHTYICVHTILVEIDDRKKLEDSVTRISPPMLLFTFLKNYRSSQWQWSMYGYVRIPQNYRSNFIQNYLSKFN
jgi:hypothetical protein